MNAGPKNYDDIINIKYPFALKHTRMSMMNRAGRFSAFKALSGYDEEIEEAGRVTDIKIELDESAKEILDAKLQLIKERICNSDQPLVRIVYFVSDTKKTGGRYESISEKIKKVDTNSMMIQTVGGLSIQIENIYEIEGDIFEQIEM